MIVGNDISKFQGDVNFDTYKNNSNFLIVKATEGVGYIDPKLVRNQSEARRVGLPLGYYSFARPDLGNPPEAEAQFFLDRVGTLREGEVLCLDYEVSKIQTQVDWCKKWLDYVFQKTGVRPLIYMSESYVNGLNWQAVVDGGYGLWIAKYAIPSSPDASFNKGKWPVVAMYQWSSSQQVPGISGNVDANVFYGDVVTFKKYGYKPVAPQPPVEDPKDKQIRDLTQQLNDQKTQTQNAIQQLADFKSGCRDRVSQLQGSVDNLKSFIG